MNKRATLTKPSEKKGKDSLSENPKENFFQSIDSPINDIMNLQRTIGNQEVQRLYNAGIIQAKLKIGSLNDMYEQEADRIAEQVMRMPETNGSSVNSHSLSAQKQSTCPECMEKKEIQTKLFTGQAENVLQTKQANNRTLTGTSTIESGINSLRRGGQPLPESARSFFESRFGYDFRRLRIHTGSQADKTAKSINARAFTIGQDIVFGTGQYSPETTIGKHLIAHELVHVIHQNQNLTKGSNVDIMRACRKHPDEDYYRTNERYCLDDWFSPLTHSDKRCYREIPEKESYWECPPGEHVCFDETGQCEGSPDKAAPAEGRDSDGTCNWSTLCVLAHTAVDFVPAVAKDIVREAREMWEAIKWGVRESPGSFFAPGLITPLGARGGLRGLLRSPLDVMREEQRRNR